MIRRRAFLTGAGSIMAAASSCLSAKTSANAAEAGYCNEAPASRLDDHALRQNSTSSAGHVFNGVYRRVLNGTHADGYANQSIASIANILTCRVERYASEREISIIKTVTLEEVQRIREMKYIPAGRF